MKFLRKFLGILVMFAGILGLVLSLAGLAGVWMVKPSLAGYATAIIDILDNSITTSQETMKITAQALGATVDSVDALSVMLSATAVSVQDSQPLIEKLNVFMGENLPATMEAATNSLKAAQQAADVLDGSIRSLDNFRFMMSSVPLVGSFVEKPTQAYNPDVPLAESLGEIAVQLEALPDMFVDMASAMDNTDDNLVTIQTSLVTMSDSVKTISYSLTDYENMVINSQSSMENLRSVLTNVKSNLDYFLQIGAIVLSLIFFWLLAAQVVILSQGWELFQGTAGRMEGGDRPVIVQEVKADAEQDVEAKIEETAQEKVEAVIEEVDRLAEGGDENKAEIS